MYENAFPQGIPRDGSKSIWKQGEGQFAMGGSKRIAWVDHAKGFAIIGVFVLHSNAPEDVIHVMDMFCMPLFFLLSGFVFSIRKYPSFLPFLWNKVRTLVFPGLFFAVLPFIVERVIRSAFGDSWSVRAYVKWMVGYVINMRGHEGLGNIPWFLVCLFLVELGGYVLLRAASRFHFGEQAFAVIGVASVLIGYAYSKFIHIVLPWGGDIALSMFGFFIFGYVLREHREWLEHALRPLIIVPALVLLVGAALLNTNQPVNVYLDHYGNLVFYLVGAVCGIWAVLSICRALARVPSGRFAMRALTYWGRNTLTFYCVNAIIYSGLIPLMLGRLGLDSASGSVTNQLLCLVDTIAINLIICSVAAEIVNRWLPGVLGRSK